MERGELRWEREGEDGKRGKQDLRMHKPSKSKFSLKKKRKKKKESFVWAWTFISKAKIQSRYPATPLGWHSSDRIFIWSITFKMWTFFCPPRIWAGYTLSWRPLKSDDNSVCLGYVERGLKYWDFLKTCRCEKPKERFHDHRPSPSHLP